MSTRDAIFSEMTGQGWTLVAASGDRGAYDDCSHLAVSFPASDPNVVGAGGTELSLSSGADLRQRGRLVRRAGRLRFQRRRLGRRLQLGVRRSLVTSPTRRAAAGHGPSRTSP